VTGSTAQIQGDDMIDEQIARATEFLEARIGRGIDCAIILGTGLGGIVDDLVDPISIPYADIPHFPQSGVSGHSGTLVAGTLADRRVVILQGRAHYYENGDAAAMRVPIGALARLGDPVLILTNASGSLHLGMPPGSIVCITDHINFSGMNPLIGESSDQRFVSMTDAYEETTRMTFQIAAAEEGIKLHEGVYMWFSGPSFETPAEIRAARVLGADLVGMSTVPEVILARYYGLEVAALSVVTNYAAGIKGASPSHAETKDVAASAASDLRDLIRFFVSTINGY
jgi:purine-nucleoside phosphorylase